MKPRVLLVPLILWFATCKDSPPEPPKPSGIALAVEDASCTEAWLKVSSTAVPATVALTRLPAGQAGDGHRVLVSHLTSPDSLLVDQGLLPKHTYTYQAVRLNADSTAAEASAPVQATTMDTTSHNFTWHIDTLGVTSSVLYDVAIINDTLAYAVGEIYLRDSTGQIDPQAWNAAKWDGQRWELKRIPFVGSCSAVLYPPLKAMWVFSASNILVTNGGSIVRYDGANATMDCSMNSLLAGAINKIFATSPQDVYAVGNAGAIVHYTNGTWQRVESGTTVDLRDIDGSSDGKIVWVCGYRSDYSTSVLLQMKQQQLRTILELPLSRPPVRDSLSGSIATIWASSERIAEVGTSGGVYRIRSTSRYGEATRVWFPSVGAVGFFNRIRGSAGNNVFVVGDFCTIAHLNGVSWNLYQEFFTTNPPAPRFWSVSVTERIVIAVGTAGGRAILFRGEK